MGAVNDNSQVYYKKTYWNDIPAVAKYINRICSDQEGVTWTQGFKQDFAKKKFKHGLFILCGNGWVEREFIDLGIVNRATAFDYSQDLLDQAKKKKRHRNISYFQADVNKLSLPENTFDLVVNVAGLHHVQYLSRFHLKLCRAMTDDGVMVSFDYVGPSRNQYSKHHWQLAHRVNNRLPQEIRAQLKYPDLITMLHTDPTEAINSALIFKTHQDFFDIKKRRDFGGGIAYLLLTHNSRVSSLSQRKLTKYASKLINIDSRLTKAGVIPTLFSYWVSTPKKIMLQNKSKIQSLLFKEKIRELINSINVSFILYIVLLKKIWQKVSGQLWWD